MAANRSRKPSKALPIPVDAFQQICQLVLVENFDLDEVATRFSVDPKTLRSIIDRTREQMQEKIAEQAAEMASEQELKRLEAMRDKSMSPEIIAQRMRDTLEEHYLWASSVAKLLMMEIANAKKENVPVGSKEKTIRALERSAQALRVCRQERMITLGVREYEYESDEDLPVLSVERMSAEDMDELRQQQALEASTFDIIDDVAD